LRHDFLQTFKDCDAYSVCLPLESGLKVTRCGFSAVPRVFKAFAAVRGISRGRSSSAVPPKARFQAVRQSEAALSRGANERGDAIMSVFLRSFWAALLLSGTPVAADGVDHCHMFEEDSRLFHHVIHMQLEQTQVPITLPANFYQTRAMLQSLSKGPERDGERFWLDLDTWEGLNESDQISRHRAGNDRSVAVVLHDVVDLEALLRFGEDFVLGSVEKRSALTGVHAESPAAFDPRLQQVNLFGKRSSLTDEIYVDRAPDGSVQSLITCGTHLPYPICEQEFRAEGLDVKLRYYLSQRPHWFEIEEAVRTILRCAVDPKYRPENDKRTK
jgi:hypothetical protein